MLLRKCGELMNELSIRPFNNEFREAITFSFHDGMDKRLNKRLKENS